VLCGLSTAVWYRLHGVVMFTVVLFTVVVFAVVMFTVHSRYMFRQYVLASFRWLQVWPKYAAHMVYIYICVCVCVCNDNIMIIAIKVAVTPISSCNVKTVF
jgi:uncharacterized membrane protein YesL